MSYMKFWIGLVLVVGVGLLWEFYGVEMSELEVEKPEQYKTFVISRRELASHVSKKPTCANRSDGKSGTFAGIYSINSAEEKIETFSEKVWRDTASMLDASEKGDAPAAIAIYSLIRSCFPLATGQNANSGTLKGPGNCPALPSEIVKNPLEIVDIAARAGSMHAKTFYAQNSSAVAAGFRALNTDEGRRIATEIDGLAERYGTEAAEAGVLEASEYMVRSYYTGRFGSRDPALAYRFILPLTSDDPNGEHAKFAQHLKKQISDVDARRAEATAFGCDNRIKQEDSLISPFG